MKRDFLISAGDEDMSVKVDLSYLHKTIKNLTELSAKLEVELAAEKYERKHAQAKWRDIERKLHNETSARLAAELRLDWSSQNQRILELEAQFKEEHRLRLAAEHALKEPNNAAIRVTVAGKMFMLKQDDVVDIVLDYQDTHGGFIYTPAKRF